MIYKVVKGIKTTLPFYGRYKMMAVYQKTIGYKQIVKEIVRHIVFSEIKACRVYMKRFLCLSSFVFILCLLHCNAQTPLPISGHNVKYNDLTGGVNISFTNAGQEFFLSDMVDWGDYESYTVYFREPVSVSDIHIGNDVVPVGTSSFKGHFPYLKNIHWEASNGQKFEKNIAWIAISSSSPVVVQIKEVVLNKKDGSTIICHYPPYSPDNGSYIYSVCHFEADNGEEYEQMIDASCKPLHDIEFYSGKVVFNGMDSYIGGTIWAGKTNARLLYCLELNKPVLSDYFSWKYKTEKGNVQSQQIAKGTTTSELSVEEDVIECSVVWTKGQETGSEILDVKMVSIKSVSQTTEDEPKTQLVVWRKDGTKVAYSLAEKPKVTFTATDLVITSKEVEVNYPLEKMARFTYESSSESSSIINLETDESPFKLTNESLLFPALKANSTVSIYALNGSLVFKKTVRQSGEYAFPISNLIAGVYIINVNGLTYKIVKR